MERWGHATFLHDLWLRYDVSLKHGALKEANTSLYVLFFDGLLMPTMGHIIRLSITLSGPLIKQVLTTCTEDTMMNYGVCLLGTYGLNKEKSREST